MNTVQQPALLRIALPKGRMNAEIVRLLAEAGVSLSTSSRGYRPRVSLRAVEAKILKPQNIIEMLHAGTRDVGFAGADWAAELRADLVEVMDTGLDAVRLVVAAPGELLSREGRLPDRSLVVASEYQTLSAQWIARRGKGDRFIRSYGATEVFPPEDADCIIDVAASGATLEANGLVICDEVMRSSTRLYASRAAWDDPARRRRIEEVSLLLRSVLEARRRVMLELNAPEARLAAIVEVLPCMRQPTLSRLAGDAGFAVKSAVPREALPTLIPLLKERGGTDIVISPIAQVVA
ncbi:MAG: ATP phosphoribosyltransferase [Phycisphaeraceae bacterium]|nr:ATP phosphoribosyltransferase [Phycisphaeraceae bacterium]